MRSAAPSHTRCRAVPATLRSRAARCAVGTSYLDGNMERVMGIGPIWDSLEDCRLTSRPHPRVAPRAGLEPATLRLTAGRTTIVLSRNEHFVETAVTGSHRPQASVTLSALIALPSIEAPVTAIACLVCWCLSVAVWTNQPKINLAPVVGVSIDMIKNQRRWLALPRCGLANCALPSVRLREIPASAARISRRYYAGLFDLSYPRSPYRLVLTGIRTKFLAAPF